jgi:hypothetical protein
MTRWTVTLADGTRLGTVRASTYEEALGAAIVLAAGSEHPAQRLSVARAPPSEEATGRSIH